jgi:hypothetical protein
MFFSIQLTFAQPYGNEWINYNQPYYKIKVIADGMHRIPYTTLNAVIPNLQNVNSSNFALYHNGKEVPIFVSSNSTLTTTDYIDFYGRRNLGDMDSVLYDIPGSQPHPFYSFFTDTSAFFLTVNSSSNNFRFVVTPNDTLSPMPTPETHFWHTTRVTYTNTYNAGRPFLAGTSLTYKPKFDEAEGWGSIWLNASTALFNIALPAPSFFNGAGLSATLRAGIASRSNENHNIATRFNTINFNPLVHLGYKFNRLEEQIPISNIAANNTFSVKENGTGVSTQQNLVHYAELIYPRRFEFGNATSFYFKMQPSLQKQRIDITQFNSQSTQPILYDLTNGLFIKNTNTVASATKTFVFPASSLEREFFICNDIASAYRVVNRMDSITFINYSLNPGNYLIITHPKLFDTAGAINYVEEYRKYRDRVASPTTGNYDARIFDINQLRDQFAYGIEKSPLAIRNFSKMAFDTWNPQPSHLLIIGKGREYLRTRTQVASYNQSLVPTFGFPGSDYLLTGERGNNVPNLAVGRIAAERPSQIKDVLDKLSAYELLQRTFGDPYQTKTDKEWMKQVLHFSGGENVSEQNLFKLYLANYERIAKDTSWGANVTTYTKTGSAPVSTTLAQVIKNQINNGVSLVTFFGHSASTAFDISIDEPENYSNTKFPMILSNGCFTGFIHDVNPGYSERFVFAPNKAAIGFVATSSLSRSDALYQYSLSLYQNLNRKKYTSTFGEMMRQTIQDVDASFPTNDFYQIVAHEMTLHGDPAIKLNQYEKPDYEIDASSVYFTPNTVDAGRDSFDVNIITTNLGKAIVDTAFSVKLRRTVFDLSNNPIVFDYFKKVEAPYYKDTVAFRLPTRINVNLGYGQNTFDVLVESDLRIDELSETNNGNLQRFNLFIESDDIVPVYPYEFSIVPRQGVVLKSSTVNPFAPLRTYIFEIDTTELFNSPLKRIGNITQTGGVVKWQPNLVMFDSTVYYWRVSRDSTSPTTAYNWKNTSFLYLKDEYPGWNQSHYYQYQKDNYNDFLYLDNDRVFKYPPTVYDINVNTGWSNAVGGTLPAADVRWDYNSVNMHRFRMGSCGFLNGITFGVIDGNTFQPWASKVTNTNYAKFGNFHCSNRTLDQNGFDFLISGNHPEQGIPWTQVINNFLDSIPSGSYIVMYSSNRPAWTTMDQALITRLTGLGATSLQQYKDGTIVGPYTFFGQIGNPSVSDEATDTTYSRPLNKDYQFNGIWNKGSMESTVIGPAKEWGSMHWRNFTLENQSSDNQSVSVYGISGLQQQNFLFNLQSGDTVIQFINPQQYPYLKLKYNTQDDTTRTPAQLYYWRVLYKPLPEGAMNPSAYFKIENDSIGLGDTLDVAIAFENISNMPMDSILTYFNLKPVSGSGNIDAFIRNDSLPVGDTVILRYKAQMLNTSFVGLNKMVIEANPNNDQPEQFHFNNYAVIDFQTYPDNINPLLDVTFDGRRIMNGELVSAKPTILVSLKDENKFLALDDTSLVKVYLKYPSQPNPVPFIYDNSTLTFYPPTGDIAKNNRARVEFKPVLLQDGTYELLIKDRDKTGNVSSNTDDRFLGNYLYDYRISFEVVNKPMISNVLNYPNPFTTSTQFIFTITGSELPSYMKIQIMTLTGRVVKEIMKEELGPLHIGTNRTQYTWDGRDEFGDLLANGVYFYRVVTNLNGNDMEHLQSGSKYLQNSNFDKYFKKGFGKMVILR